MGKVGKQGLLLRDFVGVLPCGFVLCFSLFGAFSTRQLESCVVILNYKCFEHYSIMAVSSILTYLCFLGFLQDTSGYWRA